MITKEAGTSESSAATQSSKTLVLEWTKLEITRNWDKTWDLYFLVEVDHPTDSSKKVVLTYPSEPINFTKRSDNVFKFGAQGDDICVIPMPAKGGPGVRVHCLQSKEKTRNVGRVLRTISEFADDEVGSKLGAAAAKNPYVAAGIIVNKGVSVVAKLIEETKDKDRGFAVMTENSFSALELKTGKTELRKAVFSTKDLTLSYRWRMVD
jgi:hypothetical protein